MGTTWAMTMVALLAAAVGAGTVWWAAKRLTDRSWSGIGAAAAGLLAAATVAMIAIAVMGRNGLNAFGAIHVAYLCTTITVPLVGLAVAGTTAVRRHVMPMWSATLAVPLLVPGLVGWYATHVEPYRLQVAHESIPLSGDTSADQPIRIGVLSDLQTNDVGEHEHRAIEQLLDEEPDLILMPGDLFQGTPAEFDREEDTLRELLSRLDAPHGVYFVHGDTDARSTRRAERALEDADVVILDNEVTEVTVRGRVLRIGGNSLGYDSDAARQMRNDLEGPNGSEPDTVRILLSHRPDAALELTPDSPVDLVVAGHTHGGQVVAPGLGPLLTLSDIPRHAARGGLHEVNNHPLYVSPGVGLERGQAPQVRLFSRPTIGILELG